MLKKNGKNYGKTGFAYNLEWPKVNEKELQGGVKNIPVQINGKLRATVEVSMSLSSEEILEAIKSDSKVQELLTGKEIKKEIYVPGKIYNVVI